MTDSDDAFIAWRDVRRKHWIAARKAEYLQHGNIDEQLAERLATQDWDNGPGQGRTATSGIEFEGGPEDGNVLHGLGARIIEGVDPPFVCFSIDGRYAYPSTGDVIDTRTRKIVATLADETGRAVESEKLLEVVFAGGRVVRVGDQFGLGGQR